MWFCHNYSLQDLENIYILVWESCFSNMLAEMKAWISTSLGLQLFSTELINTSALNIISPFIDGEQEEDWHK